MTDRAPPKDLDAYLPDKEAMEALLKEPFQVDLSRVDPELLAQLKELNRMSSNPDIMRLAPPSETAYVPPTALPLADAARAPVDDVSRVRLAVPPSRNESPTQPSLKRLEGEPEVPGVVQGPAAARGSARAREGSRVSVGRAAFAGLVVLTVALVAYVVLRGPTRRLEEPRAASTATTIEPARATPPVPVQSTTPAPSGAPSSVPVASAVPAPSAAPTPSVEPSATASAAVPLPTGTPKHPPRRTPEEPHDAPPSPPGSAVATTAPSTPPITPTSKGPDAPSPQPEF